jgi:DNA uptake protein ComE-like DNA-binding protein
MGVLIAGVLLATAMATGAAAQVGKSLGVVDVNTVSEKDLATFPHMTPAIVKAIAGKRPFMSITDLNTLLIGQGLTQAQANEFYGKAFVHINLNTAPAAEILLVPNAGKRMAHEFDEYRPWRSYAQFAKEIGKYVDANAVARLAQYTFIPINANTASDDVLMTIPGADAGLVAKIKAGRPYKDAAAVDAAVGKRVARYLVTQ